MPNLRCVLREYHDGVGRLGVVMPVLPAGSVSLETYIKSRSVGDVTVVSIALQVLCGLSGLAEVSLCMSRLRRVGVLLSLAFNCLSVIAV